MDRRGGIPDENSIESESGIASWDNKLNLDSVFGSVWKGLWITK